MITKTNVGPHIVERVQARKYIRALEEDFIRSWRFVDPVEDNFNTYSVEYARLILEAGSLPDVFAKRLCELMDPSRKAPDSLHGKQQVIASANLHRAVCHSQFLEIRPWKSWAKKKPTEPTWWRAYNSVKHDRMISIKKANLENTWEALAGCLVMQAAAFHDWRPTEVFHGLNSEP